MNRHTKNNEPAAADLGRRAYSGFTLVELIVVTTIVGILLAVGVPSFRYVTTANRVASEINGLLGDLQFARAEAIKQGQSVSVCASTNGTSCATLASGWQTGWLVFTDSGTPGTIDGSDAILRIQKSFGNQDTLRPDNGMTFISFNREGFALGLGNAAAFVLHDGTSTAQYTRCLSATIVGALSTQTSGHQTAGGTTCQ